MTPTSVSGIWSVCCSNFYHRRLYHVIFTCFATSKKFWKRFVSTLLWEWQLCLPCRAGSGIMSVSFSRNIVQFHCPWLWYLTRFRSNTGICSALVFARQDAFPPSREFGTLKGRNYLVVLFDPWVHFWEFDLSLTFLVTHVSCLVYCSDLQRKVLRFSEYTVRLEWQVVRLGGRCGRQAPFVNINLAHGTCRKALSFLGANMTRGPELLAGFYQQEEKKTNRCCVLCGSCAGC